VLRQTIRKRLQAKLKEFKAELARRMHHPIPEVGKWLRSVVSGHYRYYRVPSNSSALFLFRSTVGEQWRRAQSRRSQKRLRPLDADETAPRPVAPRGPHLPPLSRTTLARHHLRQEPDADNPLVRICAGGEQSRSLPRPHRRVRSPRDGAPIYDEIGWCQLVSDKSRAHECMRAGEKVRCKAAICSELSFEFAAALASLEVEGERKFALSSLQKCR
jgi:hypothetical protein